MSTLTRQEKIDASMLTKDEVRELIAEARALNTARLGRESAQQALLAQASGTATGTRPSHVRILD